ncbi:Dihydroorotate dehydrogenase B (NAD(+)), catalytic subunit [Novipirellula aureliae]|uniref:Dihydroorotate dehydrogenase B (NAD(+)), catalytic subunit n=1 Tax=Novipirellula aureliae TaxID=2527966 RepID=A0A5C6E4Q7_9BACT|nr:alpha-hydroxy-acid oxidizing protein [Novipirellula aureliae]TWU43484.1 Dihydroorotate dehydrogenase B (NAD(+)), catalytic subunit [Novipirellula aureliae]
MAERIAGIFDVDGLIGSVPFLSMEQGLANIMNTGLNITFLGIELTSPVIVGSCPLTIEPEAVRQLACAGAGAIVLPSILQEQIVYSALKTTAPNGAMDHSGYQPQQDEYNGGIDNYLTTIRTLKRQEKIPILGSINGSDVGIWIEFAKEIQDSGADALQLTWPPILSPPDVSADAVEAILVDAVRHLRKSISIPIAVKLNQRFTNIASVAHQLHDAGADGLILFTHVPEWDVTVNRMHWTVRWELSPIHSLGQTLEGIVHARIGGLRIPIAASGGVRTGEDAIKTMIAGADVVMVTSEIYREGPDVVCKINQGIRQFLTNSPHHSLRAFQQARPSVELGPMRKMRLEYVEPLTRTTHYFDPTPNATTNTGNGYGHKAT